MQSIINRVAVRANRLAATFDTTYPVLDAEMDLHCVHEGDCPLDLVRLLSASDGDFGHDVFGIRRFLNRRTGRLEAGFQPRCAMPETVTAT